MVSNTAAKCQVMDIPCLIRKIEAEEQASILQDAVHFFQGVVIIRHVLKYTEAHDCVKGLIFKWQACSIRSRSIQLAFLPEYSMREIGCFMQRRLSALLVKKVRDIALAAAPVQYSQSLDGLA